MTSERRRRTTTLSRAVGVTLLLMYQAWPAAQAGALKIVVLEGERAVNIIQQRTAVAPVIEVRDRNDQPVSGALIRFAIQKGRASFNGARTLTATTDALGRATAAGLTPIGNGPMQIGATAAFQGQTAAITIAQTNVMTAAQASAVAAGGSGTAGGGGGLSHLAVAGIAGGAGAGIAGALLASKKSSGTSSSSITSLTGSFATQLVMTTVFASATGSFSCASTRSITGTLAVEFERHNDGTVTGTGSTGGTEAETAITQPCQPTFGTVGFPYRGPLTGSTANMTFNQQTISSSAATVTNTFVFTGSLTNGVISGTITFSHALSGLDVSNGQTTTLTGSGTTTFPVTLR